MYRFSTTGEIRLISEMSTTHTAKQIAEHMGCNVNRVYNLAKRNGVRLTYGASIQRTTHDRDTLERVMRLRESGLMFKQVAEAMGTTTCNAIYLYERAVREL